VEGDTLKWWILRRSVWLATILAALSACPILTCGERQDLVGSVQSATKGATSTEEPELKKGIELTRKGLFADAIPHFLAAESSVGDEYAIEFNLALCYVGTKQFPEAIRKLARLREGGQANANVENLLAQALIGNGRPKEGWEALKRAAVLTPKAEKLYAFVADACADRHDYPLGLRVVELGLQNLPNSPRLHYQRGFFLSLLDRFDEAKDDFILTEKLAPQSEVAVLAEAEGYYFAGNLPDTIRVARAAVQEGRANYLVLTVLGEALLRSGAVPGQPEFAEAESALRKSVETKPGYPSSEVALGHLLLLERRLDEALAHLEKGRELDPRNPAVYVQLNAAYRRRGESEKADEALAILAKLNEAEAARIKAAPGGRKAISGSEPD
jgi:tetratricopeptide (TPR) repeat protein